MQAQHCISQHLVWVSSVAVFPKKQRRQKQGGQAPGYEGGEERQWRLATIWLYRPQKHFFLKLFASGNQVTLFIDDG